MTRVFLIASIFLAAIVIAVGAATYLPSYQQCESRYAQAARNNEPEKTDQAISDGSQLRVFFRCEGAAVDANNGTLTAIATVFLTVITGVLAWLAYRQNITARAQLRAYVSVEVASSPGLRQGQGKGIRFEFRPDIVNNGQTPANRVEVISKIDVSEFKIPPNFNYRIPPNPPGFVKSVLTLGSGQKRFHHCIMPRNLTRDELRRVIKATLRFHIWGTVTYFDIFDVRHYTNFSYVIFVPVKKRANTIWNSTEHHNDSD